MIFTEKQTTCRIAEKEECQTKNSPAAAFPPPRYLGNPTNMEPTNAPLGSSIFGAVKAWKLVSEAVLQPIQNYL